MNDRAWEQMLQNELSQMPLPEDMMKQVTPWRPAMKRVLIGLFLNMFTIRFFCLQYILPVIGLIMMLLGFEPCAGPAAGFRWHGSLRWFRW